MWRVHEVAALTGVEPVEVYHAIGSGELVAEKRRKIRGRPGNGRPVRATLYWAISGASIVKWHEARIARWRARNEWTPLERSGDVEAKRSYWREAQERSRARRKAERG